MSLQSKEVSSEDKNVLIAFAQSSENNGLLGITPEGKLVHSLLQEQRKLHGFSSSAFAHRLHVAHRRIEQWESLSRLPSNVQKTQISSLLDTSEDTLFPLWLHEFVPTRSTRKQETSLVEWITEEVVSRRELLQIQDIERVYGVSSIDPEEIVERHELARIFRNIFTNTNSHLRPREQKVLKEYFGFDRENQAPLEKIARELGISREYTRQVLHASLAMVRVFANEYNIDNYKPIVRSTLAQTKTIEDDSSQAIPSETEEKESDASDNVAPASLELPQQRRHTATRSSEQVVISSTSPQRPRPEAQQGIRETQGEIAIVVRRGQDRSVTVDVTNNYRYSSKDEALMKVQSTKWFYRMNAFLLAAMSVMLETYALQEQTTTDELMPFVLGLLSFIAAGYFYSGSRREARIQLLLEQLEDD